jgi:DNA repair exonuclease SbcCD nuclease subunit
MTDTTYTPSLAMMKKNIMLNSRVAVFSDLHMGVHCNSPMWHKIAVDWADWFATQLKRHEIKDVIFCGDFFHDRDTIAVNTMQVACEVLNKLMDFNLHIFPGNHDCFYKQHAEINSMSIIEGWKNITVYHAPQLINIGENCSAMMCPWGTTIDDVQPCDALFGHFEIQTFKMNTFKLCDHGLSIRKLLEKSPLVFSGHFHFRDERLFEIGKITYVGNPFQMDANDSNNIKGFYIFDGDLKKQEFFENDASPLIYKLKLSRLCNEETEIDELHSIVANNIIEFIIDEDVGVDNIEMIKSKLKSFAPLEIKFTEDVIAANDAVELQTKEIVDVEQAFIEFIEIMNYPNKQELQQYSVMLCRKFK